MIFHSKYQYNDHVIKFQSNHLLSGSTNNKEFCVTKNYKVFYVNYKRLIFYLFLLFSICNFSESSCCASDNPNTLVINSDMQYSYATERFEQHDYQTAIVEFNRFIYFFQDDKRVKNAIFKKGFCLLHTKRYVEAITAFKKLAEPLLNGSINSIYINSSGEFKKEDSPNSSSTNREINSQLSDDLSISIESLFMLTTTFLAMERDGSAEMVLQDFLLLNDERHQPEHEDRALYALVLIYIARASKSRTSLKDGLNALEKAVEYINKISSEGKTKYKANLIGDEILKLAETVETKQKNPVVAGIASIVPGGGFAYCNRYQDAFVAFLLNSAFVLASVESFEDGNSALGCLIGFVGFGFYGGSIYGGISSAHKHNKAILIKGIDDIRKEPLINMNSLFQQNSTNYGDISVTEQKSVKIREPVLFIEDNNNESQNRRIHKIPLFSIQIPF